MKKLLVLFALCFSFSVAANPLAAYQLYNMINGKFNDIDEAIEKDKCLDDCIKSKVKTVWMIDRKMCVYSLSSNGSRPLYGHFSDKCLAMGFVDYETEKARLLKEYEDEQAVIEDEKNAGIEERRIEAEAIAKELMSSN